MRRATSTGRPALRSAGDSGPMSRPCTA
jgi:hypothetical protein